MLGYFHGMSCQVILSEMPILLPRSIILAPSLTLPSPKPVSRLMKQMDYTETVNPAVKILVSQVFCHETTDCLPLLFIIHCTPSNPQSRCIAADILSSQSYACPKGASGLSMVVLKGTMEIRGSRNTAMNAAAYSHPPVNHGSCFLWKYFTPAHFLTPAFALSGPLTELAFLSSLHAGCPASCSLSCVLSAEASLPCTNSGPGRPGTGGTASRPDTEEELTFPVSLQLAGGTEGTAAPPASLSRPFCRLL